MENKAPLEAEGPAEPRALPAGAGTAWLGAGWDLFKRDWGIWIGLALALMLIVIVLSLIPFLGTLAVNLLWPVFGGGLMLGCRAQDNGEPLTFGHLFAGFQNQTGSLVGIGAFYLVAMIVLTLVVGLFGMGGAHMAGLGSAGEGIPPMGGAMLLAMLIALALAVPLAMAVWFAPALVVLRGMGTMDALKFSFFGCLRNIVPFLIYGVILFLLGIIASIPLGLGFLVLTPVAIASQYSAYKAIFG